MFVFNRIPTLSGLALVLGLAACATPQQRCIAGASADLRTIQTQIETAEVAQDVKLSVSESGFALASDIAPLAIDFGA